MASVYAAPCPENVDYCATNTVTDPITDPQPTLRIDYYDSDVDVYVLDYNLTRASGSAYAIGYQQIVEFKEYYFPVQGYLLDGEYEFTVIAEDADGNRRQDTFIFTIASDDMDIWIATPRIPAIPARNQTIGISQQVPFDVVIETEVPAQCRIKRYTAADKTKTKEQLYNTNNLIISEEDSTLHQFQAIASTSTPSGLQVGVSPFDYQQYLDVNSYVVVCRIDSGSEFVADQYAIQELFLGTDTTPPVATLLFHPAEIIDPSAITTTFNLTSDDAVMCALEKVQYHVDPKDYSASISTTEGVTAPFDDQYLLLYNFNEKKSSFSDGTRRPYEYQATCTNMVGLSSVATGSFAVELDYAIAISLAQHTFSESTPSLPISTTIAADCHMNSLDTQTTGGAFTTTGATSHELAITTPLTEGKHQVEVTCVAGVNTATKRLDFSIYTTPPSRPTLSTASTTCALYPTVSMNVTDESLPIDYEVTVLNASNEVILDRTFTDKSGNETFTYELSSSERRRLTLGQTYTWSVIAKKTTELASPAATAAFTFDETGCIDTSRAPRGEVTVTAMDGGKMLNVSCLDDDCTTTFSYAITQASSCAAATPFTTVTYDRGVFMETSGLFCYSIFDLAGNSYNGSEEVIVTDHCSNLLRDGDETGIDCGGSCEACAVADQCTQDADCTGNEICSREQSCTLDQDNDGLPDDWEMEFFNSLSVQATDDSDSDGIINLEEYRNGTDPTVVENQNTSSQDPSATTECANDFDCGVGEVCNAFGSCVPQQSQIVPDGPDTAGIILLIIGLILAGAGAGYIYYSRGIKQQQRPTSQSAEMRQQQELIARRQALEHKKMQEMLEKRHAAQSKKREEEVDKRHKARSSVFDSFTEQQQAAAPEKKEPSFSDILAAQKVTQQDGNQASTNNTYLDDGLGEEYVDVRDLGVEKKGERRVFDNAFASLENLNSAVTDSDKTASMTSQKKNSAPTFAPVQGKTQETTGQLSPGSTGTQEQDDDTISLADLEALARGESPGRQPAEQSATATVAQDDQSSEQPEQSAKKPQAATSSAFTTLEALAKEITSPSAVDEEPDTTKEKQTPERKSSKDAVVDDKN